MGSGDARLYYFKATAPEGGVTSGQIEATGQADAINKLVSRGFKPLRLESKPLAETFLQREISFFPKRLSIAECHALTGEMSVLVGAGIEIIDALGALSRSLPRRSRLLSVVLATRQGMRLGQSFSSALQHSGFEFPPDLLTIIRVGEETASVGKSLDALNASYKDKLEFDKILVGAISYPLFLLAVSGFVVLLLVFFVSPNLVGLFQTLDRPLPTALAMMNLIGSFTTDNVIGVSIGFALASTALALGTRTRVARNWLRSLAFVMPIVGDGLRWSATQRMATTLQLYLARQSPISAAISNALLASGLPNAQRWAIDCAASVREGKKLSEALAPINIPPKVIHLVAIGEASGRLPDVLGIVIKEARLNFERRMALFSNLLAPALIVLVGIMVGAMIFSVFSALMDINNLTF